ncbi:GNAT family N-acetyltransferase [Aerococcus urinae]|uniref:N-acetyltransferase n=2 Tax=Aerococcus urinae TaxID=1376 RepID=A0A109RET2_9LACT|nr:GNAT family N-acetyltransferase [Aerococcus urinae]AMB96611.1 hypothetical protein AWM73_08865 [Aerococcus urinae]MCY3033012.1 GNAT family N-acetyltransferase [Aerococcus urinae]MCY3038156.1 GNAT family N-acetyltransferase [Aerococcus urinae]MCY3045058.1 GNAT family N-acetyltransferase [Aerococcus urinae]MCY3046218.1 GNAT family N-acetyltransferase [Aerococcus urinae]
MMEIRPVKIEDSQALAAIYRYYVENTSFTFEEVAPTSEEMAERIHSIAKAFPYYVACNDQGQVLAYAYAHPFHERSAYRYSAEISIYSQVNKSEKGLGTALYQTVERDLKAQGIKTILALVTADNQVSINFHQKNGYQLVGHLHQVGYKFDQWLDTVYLEKHI